MPKHIIAVLGCTVAAGLCASPAFAQYNSQSSPQSLPPVVVEQKKPAQAQASQAGAGSEAPEAPTPGAQPQTAGVGTQGLAKPLSGTVLSGPSLSESHPAGKDVASLLSTAAPGVSVYQNGGIAGLPAIDGLADDRVRTELNGMLITAACPNHMNPALSYVDPGNAGTVEINSGVAPVSKGGDSIGGTISVESRLPDFASAPRELLTAATLSSFYRSNGTGIGGSAAAEAATQNFSIKYTGAWSQAGDYREGGGDAVVKSTGYAAGNQTLTLSARNGSDLFQIQAGLQNIPYQAFVNQPMDMVFNEEWFFNTHYLGHFEWGTLDLRAYFQRTLHQMNFLADKGGEVDGGMPMNTDGKDYGYSIKAGIPTSPRDMIRIGNEFHGQELNDWWPPTAMMGPNTYWNIDNGTRDVLGTFAEWERKWTPQWSTLLGVRNDIVWMNTGDVQAYGMMTDPDDVMAASSFNSVGHARTDVNFDFTALTRYEVDASDSFEAGYAQKTRSPNLYERYAWGPDVAAMIGWFGDGNGYVGNLDLKPEVAHTVNATWEWHEGPGKEWDFKVTPFYSYIEDYIDVNRLGALFPGSAFSLLQFANHDAQLGGVNASGQAPLWASNDYGQFAMNGILGWVEGERLDGVALYHMMPLNAQLALTNKLGNWSSAIELQLVGDKEQVETLRNEPMTPGYALVNLRTSYTWENWRFDFSIENLFDKLYYLPLGGIDYATSMNDNAPIPVAGMGRSFNAAVTVKF